MRRIGGSVDGETRFADVAPILPLSSIRDAPPNCKRSAEIFAKTDVQASKARTVAARKNVERPRLPVRETGRSRAKFSTFFVFLRFFFVQAGRPASYVDLTSRKNGG